MLLAIGTINLGLLIGGNVFEQLYVMPGCRQAGGIATWKAFNTRNVALFFLPLAVSAGLCLVASTALVYSDAKLVAMASVVAALVLTGAYIIPRIVRVFARPRPGQTEAESLRLLGQYRSANRVRLVLAFSGLVCAVIALRG